MVFVVAMSLPEDLRSVEPLVVDASDELDNILSQVPQATHFDQYLVNAAQETDRFRAPVTEDEIKAAQKASVPANTRKSTNWAVSVWSEWSKCLKWMVLPLSTHHFLARKKTLCLADLC